MAIAEELEYMYGLERLGIQPGIAVMEQLLSALGNPERQFKSIHITGTNGKGSTCAMLESVLREAGYTVALYTSPHLYTFHERIQINRTPISDEALIELIGEVRDAAEHATLSPTFFEFTTALAFLYFARLPIDIAIIEVGMGGRYDATNVITPLVSVITNIGLDHTEYLGPTVAHVAREKAGIIKEGVPVVTAETDPAMLDIFDREAKEKHTSVVRVQDVVRTRVISSNWEGQEVEVQIPDAYLTPASPPLDRELGVERSKGEENASNPPPYEGGVRGGPSGMRIHLPLLGAHQVTNMATAIAALATLHRTSPPPLLPSTVSSGSNGRKERRTRRIPLLLRPAKPWRSGDKEGLGEVSREAITFGIKNVTWEGRLHIISREPLIIIDGAHNPDGARVLAAFLQGIPRYDVLVFAAKKGKDIFDMMQFVIPLFSQVIVTEGAFMPQAAEALAEKVRTVHANVVVEKKVCTAIDRARTQAPKDGTIVITGSLYMVADALVCFQHTQNIS